MSENKSAHDELSGFLDNAAPPLALSFRNVGDEYTVVTESAEVRDAIDSDRQVIIGDDGKPVRIPVLTVVDTEGELRSLYGKPAIISAFVTGCKRAKIEPGFRPGLKLHIRLSSLGTPSKPSYSPPQRFTIDVSEGGLTFSGTEN